MVFSSLGLAFLYTLHNIMVINLTMLKWSCLLLLCIFWLYKNRLVQVFKCDLVVEFSVITFKRTNKEDIVLLTLLDHLYTARI